MAVKKQEKTCIAVMVDPGEGLMVFYDSGRRCEDEWVWKVAGLLNDAGVRWDSDQQVVVKITGPMVKPQQIADAVEASLGAMAG